MAPRSPSTIRSQLTRLVVVSFLPIWLVSGALVFYGYSAKCAQVNDAMLDTARSLAMVVDRELSSVQAALQALGTSPAITAGDFRSVHRQARLLLETYPGADIILADATGRQRVNSFLPYGTPLPERKNTATVRRIFETGKPVVSDLFYGTVTGRPMIGVDVPVMRGGRVVYDLAMTFPYDRLVALLRLQSLPPERYCAILDGRNLVIARSRFPERYVGRSAKPKLREAVAKASEGTVLLGTNLEGKPVFATFCRSQLSNWHVVVGVPRATIMSGIYRWVGVAAAAVAAISLFGIVLALIYARRIVLAIQSLAEPVRFGGGATAGVGVHAIKETAEVAAALEHALATLSQGERRYRGIVESQTDYVDRYLPGGILTFVNDALARITGLEPAALLGESFFPFIHEDDRPEIIRTIESLCADDPIATTENRVLLPDGTHWHRWEHRALFDERGSIVEYQSVGRDITELRRVEQALRESEERFRAVVEDQTELIARHRPDGSYTFVNEAFCRFFGKTREQVVGSPWQPEAIADDLPGLMGRLRGLSPGEPVAVAESRVLSGEGELRWLQFVYRGFFDREGRLIETQAVGRDVTCGKHAEIALAESIVLLDSIIENTSDMIWSVDPVSFGLRSFNQALSDYFFSRRGIRLCAGMRPEELFPPEGGYVELWRGFYLRALEEGPFAVEYAVHAGATILELNFNLLKRGGQLFGLSVFGKDITKRKRAEETLKSYARRLIVLEEELRKRIAMELHDDIGQELTALGLNLAFIGNSLADGTGNSLRTVLEDSRQLTKEISRTVRNLMVELRPAQLDEYGLAPALRSYGEQYAKRTGIALSVRVAPDFPRLGAKAEMALFRIAQESLNNVAKHAGAREVTVAMECDGGAFRLSISDDGHGFAPLAAQPRPAGESWGLTIMRERAELIGGTFRIDALPGRGTSIAVELPLNPPPA